MILLLDTDVLIDFALDRAPYAQGAADLLDALEKRPGTAFIAWHSISNFYYLASPKQGKQKTKGFLLDLARFVGIAATTTEHLLFAGQIAMSDFEDAMQVAAAVACRASAIVTRNLKDYAKSPIPAVEPQAALAAIMGG
jgi:predicted nucleic acid-binding protein